MKLRKHAIIYFLVASTAFVLGCDSDTARTKHQLPALSPIPVTVERVTKRTADNQVEVVGTVEAVEKAEISSKITGNIINLPVELGTKVKKGELLVELSAGEISSQVQLTKAELEKARRNLAREQKLLRQNASTPKTVKSLQDSTRIAEAAHTQATIMQNYARITAPFSGIITRKMTNIGDLATPGKVLLFIEQENNLQVVTDIPEAMMLEVQKDDLLPVVIPSIDLSIKGTVAEVSPIADPSSRSAPIKLQLTPNPSLRPGQFARVTLVRERTEALAVPASAITHFGQMERVFVVSDKKAQLRLIRAGATFDGYSEILSGLSEGELVITSESQNLIDGQPVVLK